MNEYNGTEKTHIQLRIEPNEFIEEITFDPRLDNEEFLTYKKIVELLGFVNQINKSSFYDFT